MSTVREVSYELLRSLGMTRMFGNPGSTELPFLQGFPEDFTYVLGLHESVVVGMADGYAQGTGRATFVNLHTAAGLGNAGAAIMTAYHNRTPLVITAGQQDRRQLAYEPFVSGPLNDWEAAAEPHEAREIDYRMAPNPEALDKAAWLLESSRRPAIVAG